MNPRFEFLSRLRFTCRQCGDCCRSFEILLLPGEEERLAALDWGDDELSGREVAVASAEGHRTLARRSDGACIYLGEQNQCRIHERFGETVKPVQCRSYPFAFHRVGQRIGVDTSFYCRSIAERSGEPLASRVEGWRAALGKGPSDPGGYELDPDWTLEPDLLWVIEESLVALLETPGLSTSERVRSVASFIRLIPGDPSTEAAAQLRDALVAGLPKQMAGRPSTATMDRTQRSVFYQWLFVALNPAPLPWSRLPSAALQKEKKRLARAGSRFRRNKGRPWIDHRELTVGFEEIRRVDAGPTESEVGAAFLDFLVAKLKGQGFLRESSGLLPLVEAVGKLLLSYPMGLWTAKALAADRGASAVERDDVHAALRLIDRTFGRVHTSMLPSRQAQAFDWVMGETELVEAATADLLHLPS